MIDFWGMTTGSINSRILKYNIYLLLTQNIVLSCSLYSLFRTSNETKSLGSRQCGPLPRTYNKLFVTRGRRENIKFFIGNKESCHFWKYFFSKKREVMKRLEDAYNPFLIHLENNLIKEYNHLLQIEQESWKQKSRVNCINIGDANTRFFHTTTLNRIRRSRNNIVALHSKEGEWIYNQNEIKKSTLKYFNNIFITSHL